MLRLVALAALLSAPSVGVAQAPPAPSAPGPPVRLQAESLELRPVENTTTTVAWEVLGGSAGAALQVGLLVASIAWADAACDGHACIEAMFAAATFTTTITLWMPSAGVYFAGDGGNRNGRYGPTLGGNFAGLAVGSLITLGVARTDNSPLIFTALALTPLWGVAGAVLGYELSASTSSEAALLTPTASFDPNRRRVVLGISGRL